MGMMRVNMEMQKQLSTTTMSFYFWKSIDCTYKHLFFPSLDPLQNVQVLIIQELSALLSTGSWLLTVANLDVNAFLFPPNLGASAFTHFSTPPLAPCLC